MIKVVAVLAVKDSFAFDEFESMAVSIMRSHGGKLVAAFETKSDESTDCLFTEVHYLEFPNQESFDNYRNDPELLSLADLRSSAISSTQVYVSSKLKEYD